MASRARQVYLVRHGETELNRLGVVQGAGVDPGLNAAGHAQAAALFAAYGDRVNEVVTSGMVRAVETVAGFAEAGLPVRTDPRFREICWGIHEGKVAEPWMREQYAELMAAWSAGDYDAHLTDGESARELADRLRAAWVELVADAPARTLLCLHGRALRCLVCVVEGLPVSAMNDQAHSNGGVYVATESAAGWTISERNLVNHLPTPPLSH